MLKLSLFLLCALSLPGAWGYDCSSHFGANAKVRSGIHTSDFAELVEGMRDEFIPLANAKSDFLGIKWAGPPRPEFMKTSVAKFEDQLSASGLASSRSVGRDVLDVLLTVTVQACMGQFRRNFANSSGYLVYVKNLRTALEMLKQNKGREAASLIKEGLASLQDVQSQLSTWGDGERLIEQALASGLGQAFGTSKASQYSEARRTKKVVEWAIMFSEREFFSGIEYERLSRSAILATRILEVTVDQYPETVVAHLEQSLQTLKEFEVSN